MFTAILVLSHIVGFFSSIHALMSVRTPQGTIAWVVSLNALPIVSVPAYWVFGRSKFQGYVDARQAHDENMAQKIEEILRHIEPFRVKLEQDAGRIQAVERLARMRPASGSRSTSCFLRRRSD